MITSKQRAHLRALANGEDTILQIGKGGINPNLIVQIEDALEARELIKLHVLETAPVSPREAMEQLTMQTGCEPIQVIGGKIILYRESKNKKRIDLKKWK